VKQPLCAHGKTGYSIFDIKIMEKQEGVQGNYHYFVINIKHEKNLLFLFSFYQFNGSPWAGFDE